MKRENLEKRPFCTIIASSDFPFYAAPEADSVMDAYEKRIKELEKDNADLRAALDIDSRCGTTPKDLCNRIKELESQLENVQNEMYTENVDANMSLIKANERIKELENKNKNLQYSSDMWMACCKLMSEGKRNVMSSDALAEMNRIKELEAENARLKATISILENKQKENQ